MCNAELTPAQANDYLVRARRMLLRDGGRTTIAGHQCPECGYRTDPAKHHPACDRAQILDVFDECIDVLIGEALEKERAMPTGPAKMWGLLVQARKLWGDMDASVAWLPDGDVDAPYQLWCPHSERYGPSAKSEIDALTLAIAKKTATQMPRRWHHSPRLDRE